MGDPVCEPRGGVSSSRGQLTTIQEFVLVVVDPSVKIVYLEMIEITGLPKPSAWEWRELSTSTSTQGKWHSATV